MTPSADPVERVPSSLPVPYASVHPPANNGFTAFGYAPGSATDSMPTAHTPTPWYLDVSGVWSRHRAAMSLACVFAVLCGFLLGTLFSTKLWLVEGRLRFMPTSDGKEMYKSMSLLTYADLVLSDDNLEKLASEFRDRLPQAQPAKYLKAQIKVDAPRNTEIIELTMDSSEPGVAMELINRLMQLYIEFTNDLRRTTTLRASAGMLRSTIDRCDSQIRKWERTIQEYQARASAGVPLEKLDQVELDSAYAQRRKTLNDSIKAEEGKLWGDKSELDIHKSKLRQLESRMATGVATPDEVRAARDIVRLAEIKVNTQESNIIRMKEDYRNLPVEYATVRILECRVQMNEAENDLNQLREKMAEFGVIPAAGSTADPSDEAWTKLRQRLLGADSAEFDVLKPATRPAYPTSSNRKMLTAFGIALPLFGAFLLLAFIDHRRFLANAPLYDVISPQVSSRHVPRAESALLAVRIQQWISDDPGSSTNGHVNNGDGVAARRGLIIEPPSSKSMPRPTDGSTSS